MIKNITTLIFLFLFGGNVCMAQFGDSVTNKVFGKSIEGVQMAVTLNTNVIIAGSLIGLSAEIKNSSTNAIYLGETGPATDFLVLLIDNSGKIYELTDIHPKALTRSLRMKLDSGYSHSWIIPITIGKNIDSGNYTLKATRKFSANKRSFELISNLLKVQIK